MTECENTRTQKIMLLILAIISFAFFVIAVVGGFTNYTSIPFWDSWTTVGISVQPQENWLATYWGQHSEHRPVITRFFYWIGEKVFNGQLWFLVTINYIMAFLTAALLTCFINEQLCHKKSQHCKNIIILLIFAWSFCWMQHENFISEFQSQFYLVFLIPLTAFYFLYKSQEDNLEKSRRRMYFFLSCALGVISIGTMANGILALPLMLCYAFFSKMTLQRKGILFSLSVICVFLYLHDFTRVSHHGDFFKTLLQDPINLARYVFRYIGGPFYFIFRGNLWAAELSGFIFCLIFLYSFIQAVLNKFNRSFAFILLVGIFYILASALLTGGGRLFIGLEHIASRYQTPAIIAWLLLIIFYAPKIDTLLKTRPTVLSALCLIIFIGMIPSQLTALKPTEEKIYEHFLSILALELKTNDAAQIGKIFPNIAYVVNKYEVLRANKLGVYQNHIVAESRDYIGKSSSGEALILCNGKIDQMLEVESEANDYVRVAGSIQLNEDGDHISRIFLMKDDEVVGIAFARNEQKRNESAKFAGYLPKDKVASPIKLATNEKICSTNSGGQ